MSGYNPNFSPARSVSPQIRSTLDVDRYNQNSWFLDSCFLGVLVLLASSISFGFLNWILLCYGVWVLIDVGCLFWSDFFLVISTCQSWYRSIKSLDLSLKFFQYVPGFWIKVTFLATNSLVPCLGSSFSGFEVQLALIDIRFCNLDLNPIDFMLVTPLGCHFNLFLTLLLY